VEGASPGVAGRVSIGERSLYVERMGTGHPAVVFEAGLGYHSGTWDGIAEPLQELTAVVRYDRAGLGRSDPAADPRSRTAHDAADDLAMVLERADVAEPYVLVGHSFGGLICALYALAYPDSVPGMVLIDPVHPEQVLRWRAHMTPEEWAPMEAMLSDVGPEPDPAEVAATPGMDAKGEENDFMGSASQPEPIADLPPIPITVISSDPSQEGDLSPTMVQVWQELQAEYAAVSPLGRLVHASTGHFVHQEQPELVLDEIRRVLGLVRSGAHT
jgi:pimeloyl-ACP methyl ester carboxylesterase